ncbi:hypothetical protein B0T10DRAFT_497755 [Thelonectria olida]|uniref:Uncharacterized protein n=1 Tax=Thelonectria olida TaxID=1576542 RepID=A0A9P8VWF8_9HYPO|nr:hypothetical protein B0T10DRAFT_497755 [Thelonectria olida]
MPSTRPPPIDPDGAASDTLRIPEPFGSSLQVRGARAARRIYRAMGVWPWEIVPESPPKIWAINLLEDLALVVEHVAKDPAATLEDLRVELRKSLSRDRKPSYTGKLMAQDVHAAKKRFVRVSQTSPGPERKYEDVEETSLSERRSGRRRRAVSNSNDPPDSPSAMASRGCKSPNESDEYLASSITVAPDPPPSPPQPRNVKALKRSGSEIPVPDEKRARPSSPEGSRLSAAQSLMLFSSPMSAFHMTPSFPTASTYNNPTRSFYAGTLHEPLQPAAATFVAAIDSHVRSLTEPLVMAQKDIFPHRTIHQDAMSKLRTSQGGVRLIQDEIDECRETLLRLHEETSQQDALAPQLQALQENNMSLPPEIAQAIRSYDSQRAIKIEEVKRQEAAIAAKTDKLERAREELDAAEKNCSGLEAEIQRLQSAVTRGSEATRLAHMFGVVVQLGPEGLASIERIYPEIGSLLESLLAARGQPAQQPYLSQVEKVERE